MKTNKRHPDRAILHVFEKKQMMRSNGIKWTRKETDVLFKAAKKYGKDYQMITNAVQTKTVH